MNHYIPILLENILPVIVSSITVILAIWYKDKLLNKRKKLNPEDKSVFYLEMDKICASIRRSLNANGTYLAYFHNGGTFTNGINMDKFTVVGEDYDDQIRSSSYKRTYYATMINYIAYAYHRLLIDNRYYIPSTESLTVDLSLKADLCKRRIVSSYMFLIKDPVKDTPVGFFVVEYMNHTELSNESEIWKYQNKLSKLLNMTVLN